MSGTATAAVCIEAAREVAGDHDGIRAVVEDPETYPGWVATLRSLEPLGRGRYEAQIRYLWYRRTFRVRRRSSAPDTVAWEGTDGDLRVRMALVLTPVDRDRTEVRFEGSAEGADPLGGLAPTQEVARLLLCSAAAHSLAQLERAAREEPC